MYTWSDTGVWQRSSAGLPASGPFQSTRLADMDRDGDLDLVGFGDGQLRVWTGDGGGGWTEAFSQTLPAPGRRSALAVGDADHNGRPDIAIVADEGSWPSERNRLRLLAETSVVAAPDVLVTRPRANQRLINGAVVYLDWLAAVPGGRNATVDVHLSVVGPAGSWAFVASDLPNGGRHQFAMDALRDTRDGWIRVTLNTPTGSVSHAAGPLTIVTGDCYADCDGNGVLDFFDFLCYQNSIAAAEPRADCDGSGALDFFDFLCFQNAFEAGCP